MSKKSRKRNKKILGLLAAGLGAAALMKRRGTAQGVSGSDKAKFTSDAAYTGDTGANKVVADTAPINDTTFRTRHMITDSAGNRINSTNKMANIARMNAPKGIYPPGSVPMPLRAGNLRGFNRKDGGRIGAKHGGSVKGVGKAKRGFGRALKKGK